MPQFDDQSAKRISNVVRHVEAQGMDSRPGLQKYPANIPLVWFLLVENFDEDGNAEGAPGTWEASANSGDGELTAEPVVRYTVRDTTGHCGGAKGSWLCCRPLGTENGMVWEPIGGGGGGDTRLTGNLTSSTSGEGPLYIDNVQVITGTSPLEDPESAAETLRVHNPVGYETQEGQHVRVEWNQTTERWEIYACKDDGDGSGTSTIQVVTDVSVSGTAIIQTVRDIDARNPGDTSNETIHTGTTCPE